MAYQSCMQRSVVDASYPTPWLYTRGLLTSAAGYPCRFPVEHPGRLSQLRPVILALASCQWQDNVLWPNAVDYMLSDLPSFPHLQGRHNGRVPSLASGAQSVQLMLRKLRTTMRWQSCSAAS